MSLLISIIGKTNEIKKILQPNLNIVHCFFLKIVGTLVMKLG